VNDLTDREQTVLFNWLEIFTPDDNKPPVVCFDYANDIPDEFEIDWDLMMEKHSKDQLIV